MIADISVDGYEYDEESQEKKPCEAKALAQEKGDWNTNEVILDIQHSIQPLPPNNNYTAAWVIARNMICSLTPGEKKLQ